MNMQKLQMVIVIICIYMLTGNQRKSVREYYLRLTGNRSIQQLYGSQIRSAVLDFELQIYAIASDSIFNGIQMEFRYFTSVELEASQKHQQVTQFKY